MRKKNWVEFNNEPFRNEDNQIKSGTNKCSKIKIFKEKKGKKGKTITIISGLYTENVIEAKALLKKLKIFCSTGGKFSEQEFQLQGDLVERVKEFLRKQNYHL
tara:strand:+ start:557 stop:865 length:309 start_codon:yes stop_codon:yes gene_type:complete